MKKAVSVLSILTCISITASLQANLVQFELEPASSPTSFNGVNLDSDFLGLLSANRVMTQSDADVGWTFSNGHTLAMADNWAAPGPEVRFIFAGDGISLRALQYGGGAPAVDWAIEEAGGSVVASGTEDLNGAAENVDIELAAPGSLDEGLYILTLTPGYGAAGQLAILDYVTVSNSAISRAEEGHPAITAVGGWATDNNFSPSGGTTLWSNAAGDSITVEFSGTDIAVVNPYSDTGFGSGLGTFDWSINNGEVTGSIDLSATRYAGAEDFRVPTILASGLTPGEHTLTCTITSSGKPVMFDAFDTSGTFPAPVRYEAEATNSPLATNGVNLQADFLGPRSLAHMQDGDNASVGWSFSNGWARILPDNWPAPGPLLDLNFAGSEIKVRLLQYAGAAPNASWQLLGTDNALVDSGTLALQDAAMNYDLIITPPEPGLYKVVLDPGQGAGHLLYVDYFEVTGDSLERMEEDDERIYYSGIGIDHWLLEDDFGEPSGGYQAQSGNPGEFLTVDFIGSDIAVVTPFNENMGMFIWEINEGEGGAGMVDLSTSRYAGFTDVRVSTILAQGLADDEQHQLKITIPAGATSNTYIDAFDTSGTFVTSEGPASSVPEWTLF